MLKHTEKRIKLWLVYAWKDYKYFLFSFVYLAFPNFLQIPFVKKQKNETLQL